MHVRNRDFSSIFNYLPYLSEAGVQVQIEKPILNLPISFETGYLPTTLLKSNSD